MTSTLTLAARILYEATKDLQIDNLLTDSEYDTLRKAILILERVDTDINSLTPSSRY